MPRDMAMKVVNNVDALLGYWDRTLHLRFANAAYKIWFERPEQELIGISMPDLLGPIFQNNLVYVRGALDGHVQQFEQAIHLQDGRVRQTISSYYPDIDEGIVQGFSVQVIDVTRMKELEMELQLAKEHAEALATHDYLTGLPNRVHLMDRIQTALARVKRDNRLFGVVALDIDGFKSINDNHGHPVGDCVLVEIASRMKTAIRSTDTVTRLGGDEFIFLIDDVDSVDGVSVALHRLLEAVCQPLTIGRFRMTPSLSCGIAIFPHDGSDPHDLLTQSDAALYKAKRKGKNCSVFAENLLLPPDPLLQSPPPQP